MATPRRKSDPGVADTLAEKPYSFEFYQAVRLLHWLHDHGEHGAGVQGAARGLLNTGTRDAVRFSSQLSLESPAGEIYDLTPATPAQDDKPAKPPKMTVTFLGLTGPNGALPVHYTELLLERRFRNRDRTLQEFLDIFNHRLTSLFYQSWAKYHVFIDWERQTREGFLRYLLDLIGLGTHSLRDRLQRDKLGIQDQALAYYSGILAQRPHSAEGLAAIVADYFRVPTEVMQFQGRWMQLPKEQCTSLGVSECLLGEGAMLGVAVWEQQSKFRIRIGPLGQQQFRKFMPNGSGFVSLARFGNFYSGTSLDFDVQVVVKRSDVPFCVLGGQDEYAAHLGWSTWLNPSDEGPDLEDAVFPVGKVKGWRPDEAAQIVP